ncbi:MAG: alpha-hydroxy acid oxidase [Acidobacteriota bacterium]
MDLINLYDFEAAARSRLSKMAYDYYASGSWDEVTLGENRAAYERLRLQYRVLRDISDRDLSTTVLGQKVALPVIVAPTAFHRLAHDEGELATARAAAAAGTIFMLSTLATRSIEEVTETTDGPVWFQLYVYKDRGATRALVERAKAAGCGAIVLTVDAQLWPHRERDERNRFHLPEGLEAKNLHGDAGQISAGDAGSGLADYVTSLFDQSLSWPDVEWLCSLSDLPVVVKGIVHPEDARLAAEHGARAIVVSNHGGRQLDTAPATIDVLPEIAEAVGDRIEVLLDGGVRRGTDVVKALALGARAVAVGRPALWGLAVDGQAGVERVLAILRTELDRAVGLCGYAAIDDLGPELIWRPRS